MGVIFLFYFTIQRNCIIIILISITVIFEIWKILVLRYPIKNLKKKTVKMLNLSNNGNTT